MHMYHRIQQKVATLGLVTVLMFSVFVSAVVPAQAATDLQLLQSQLDQMKLMLAELSQAHQPQVLGVRTVLVSNPTELAAAVIDLQGGDVVMLAPGNYGSLSMIGGKYNQLNVGGIKYSGKTPSPTSMVTLTSQDKSRPALFNKITIGTSNITIDGLAFETPPGVENRGMAAVTSLAKNVVIKNSTFMISKAGDSKNWTIDDWKSLTNGVSQIVGINSDGDDTIIENNYVKHIQYALVAGENANNVIIRRNTVDGFTIDGVRALGDDTLVEANLVKNSVQLSNTHNDCIQSWSRGTDGSVGSGEVVGLVIRGNLCISNEDPDHLFPGKIQGVGFFDGMFRNTLIEHNIILTDTYHGIALYGGIDSIIRNNTVLDMKAGKPGPTWIRTNNHKNSTPSSNVVMENNITNSVHGATTTVIERNNYLAKIADYPTLFRNLSTFDMTVVGASVPAGVGAIPRAVGSTLPVPKLLSYGPVATSTPVVVTPATPAPTLTLSSSANSITSGGTATLTWNATNATTCTASGSWTGTKTIQGTQTVELPGIVGTQTYTLACTGAGGSVTKGVNVEVMAGIVTPPATPTLTLTTSTTSTAKSGTATLTWNATNATTCTARGSWAGTKAVQGNQTLELPGIVGTQTYTLACTGAGGSVTKSVLVAVTAGMVVTPPPTPTPTTTTATPIATTFKIGDRVSMKNNVNVRTTGLLAATTLIGTNPQGSTGALVAGPTVTNDRYGQITWFNVNFDSGFDGWVGADNYTKVAAPTPTPTLSPNVTTTATLNVRSTAGGTLIGTQPQGATGISSPETQVTINGTTWIYVNFTTGFDGYVSAMYLAGSGVSTNNQALITSLLAQLAVLQAALTALLAQ